MLVNKGNLMSKFALTVLGLTSVAVAGGCSSSGKTAWQAHNEPDAEAVVVYATEGLGASDALGYALFVENTDYRVASASMVFSMAAADEPNLNMDRLAVDSNFVPTTQRQVIVSGEGVIPQPTTAESNLTSVETNDFE
jgi:hypothetical protein